MSTPTLPQRPHLALSKLDTSCSKLSSGYSPDQAPSPASTRSGTFARLRMGAAGVRRSKSLRSLGRTRSEAAMSVYSEATTLAERPPPLPTSESELTLAHSVASSSRSMRDGSPMSMAKSFMHRSSRILTKKSSKSSLTSRTLDWIDETQAMRGEADQTRRAPRHGRVESDKLKLKISQPYDFQHIAHTAADINNAQKVGSHCGTPSRELKGIKVRDLPAPWTAVESHGSSETAASHLRTSRSMDSFKRVSRSSFSTPYPPIVPPPRKSSRRPPPLIVPSSRQCERESPTIPAFMLSGGRRPSAGSRTVTPKSPLSISTGADDSPLSMMGIAQAVTTPDETAFVIKSELASPLEDVPEDEVPSQLRSTGAPTRRSMRNSTPRMIRSGSDPVLPESAEQNEEIPTRLSRRISGHIATGIYLDLDWDEDIDYCYDQLEAEGYDPELAESDSPVSDADTLYMKERRRSNRLSRNGIPLHLRRVSAQMREHGLGVTFPSLSQDTGLSPSLAASEDYVLPSKLQSSIPLFTPDMNGDLQASYSPRSSVSQMSKYPSGSSLNASSSNGSKRTSGLATTENASTISVPDLIPSSKRKSAGTQRSSIRSQGSVHNLDASVTLTVPASGPTSSAEESVPNPALLEPTRIPLRKRSFSDSASRALNNAASAASTHTRSASHAPGSPRTHRPYTLFPPLDRIGAMSKA